MFESEISPGNASSKVSSSVFVKVGYSLKRLRRAKKSLI